MHFIATTLALLGKINIVYLKKCFWFSGSVYFFSIPPANGDTLLQMEKNSSIYPSEKHIISKRKEEDFYIQT